MEVWNRFFANAFTAREGQQTQPARPKRPPSRHFLGKCFKKVAVTMGLGIKQAAQHGASGKANAANAAGWYGEITDANYAALMSLSLTTQLTPDGAFQLPADYGSYGKHLRALSKYFNKSSSGSGGGSGSGRGGGSSTKADASVVSSAILSVALVAAVCRRDASSAEALLSVGANPSCLDENSRTPAHYASRCGDVTMLAMLFDHGRMGNGDGRLG